MLEYLYLICLLCLTFSVPILIRGCFNIHKELPTQGGNISEKIDSVAGLLDEMADIINQAIRFQEEITPIAQTSNSPIMSILNAFMSSNASPPSHASETQQTQREIYDINPPETKQAENQLDQHSS